MPGVSLTITSMPTFCGISFFFMDEMHLIAYGIGKLVFSLLNPKRSAAYRGEIGYCFDLLEPSADTTVMGNVSKYISLSKPTVPQIFEGCWEGSFGSYHAVDWEDFLSIVVPCIFLQYVSDVRAKKAIMDVINGCNRSMAREISSAEVTKIKE